MDFYVCLLAIGIIFPIISSEKLPKTGEKDILCIILTKQNPELTAKRGICSKNQNPKSCADSLNRSKCELEEAQRTNAQLQTEKTNRREKQEKDLKCVLLIDPYCGSNGFEFLNSCELAKAQKKYANLTAEKGKCSQ